MTAIPFMIADLAAIIPAHAGPATPARAHSSHLIISELKTPIPQLYGFFPALI